MQGTQMIREFKSGFAKVTAYYHAMEKCDGL
jgi:hypothetical protein